MKILITGVLGQTGSYMVDYLLNKFKDAKDLKIYGMIRHYTKPNLSNLKDAVNDKRFKIVFGDLTDAESINKLVKEIQPDYFFNFAANSFVKVSWDAPEHVFDVNTLGVLRCLESIKNYCPTCRFINAGSTEEFGNVDYIPQDEKHPLKPRSPYGASKASARHLVKVYRESYGLYALQYWCANHESPRRANCFLTKKVTENAQRIREEVLTWLNTKNKEFLPKPLYVGNIHSKRDWSHALDFCDGIWRMANQEVYRKDRDLVEEWNNDPNIKKLLDNSSEYPDLRKEFTRFLSKNINEYLFCSGEDHSVKEFIEKSFRKLDIIGIWKKFQYKDFESFGFEDNKTWVSLVEISRDFFRPAEVDVLLGDYSKANNELGWKPKISFDELINEMIRSER